MEREELHYAEVFAEAIAEDVLVHPPGTSLVRVLIRWFERSDPTHFAVHALGREDQDAVDPEDAWRPLEWPNVAEEEERTERLGGHRALIQAAEHLRGRYASAADGADDDGIAPAAMIEAIRRLPAALRAAGVPLEEHFAASACDAETRGALAVVEAVTPPAALAALRARDELPDD